MPEVRIYGTIFKVSNGTFTKLKDLTTADGVNPLSSSLVQGKDDNFYGKCFKGGLNNDGTLFKISSIGAFTKLMDFNDTLTGIRPLRSLLYIDLPTITGVSTITALAG